MCVDLTWALVWAVKWWAIYFEGGLGYNQGVNTVRIQGYHFDLWTIVIKQSEEVDQWSSAILANRTSWPWSQTVTTFCCNLLGHTHCGSNPPKYYTLACVSGIPGTWWTKAMGSTTWLCCAGGRGMAAASTATQTLTVSWRCCQARWRRLCSPGLMSQLERCNPCSRREVHCSVLMRSPTSMVSVLKTRIFMRNSHTTSSAMFWSRSQAYNAGHSVQSIVRLKKVLP